ncbi:MAG: hypothetical protein RLZZ298_324 [Pseudomonadota bacterium]
MQSNSPRLPAMSILAIALCASVTNAAAQQRGPGEPEGTTWGLGLGVISNQKPYKGVDRETQLLPLIQFENKYVQVFGPVVEAKLPSLKLGGSQRIDFRLVARMDLDGAGYEAEDATILAGMAERKGGFWAGGKAKWRNEVANVNVEWLADVSNNSKGQRFSLGLEKTWRLGEKLMLTPQVGVAWVDSNYVDYYFGVRDSEVMAGRPAYAGKSGIIPGASVRAVYRFDPHHSMMFDARVVSLADSIKDSPLVDASTENRVLMSYIYRF